MAEADDLSIEEQVGLEDDYTPQRGEGAEFEHDATLDPLADRPRKEPPQTGLPQRLGAPEADPLASPPNGHSWSWGSISNIQLNGGPANSTLADPGSTVTVDLDYSLDPAAGGCSGCVSQLVVGFLDGSKQCIYSGIGVASGHATFDLSVSSSGGTYPLWVSPQWQLSCNDALAIANNGPAVGEASVNGHDWGWGNITNVLLDGGYDNTAVTYPAGTVTVNFDYFVDSSAGGCPSCISQIVMGFSDGSTQCLLTGTQSSGHATFDLNLSSNEGTYPLWVSPQWQFNCDDALAIASGGPTVGEAEVTGYCEADNACGDLSVSGGCWCDLECIELGDCCPDGPC
ncbi:MAG: hypothetical protein AAGF11_13365 [Myxococcota bacterium]